MLLPLCLRKRHTTAFGGCGKDAADAFCRFVGFKESTAMEKDVNIKEPTILMLQVHTHTCSAYTALWSVCVCALVLTTTSKHPPPRITPFPNQTSTAGGQPEADPRQFQVDHVHEDRDHRPRAGEGREQRQRVA